jgi:RNA polymerase sigma factor (sigma-70 family)
MISIAEIRAGSEASFTEVFNEYHRKLYHYFLKKTRSEEMSGELVQLTLIRLWQFRHTLSDDHSLEVQLFNMATSALIDYFRKESSLKRKIISITDQLPETTATTQATDNFEYSNFLQSTIASLSPVRKRIFILSRIYGYSYKEIAQELSISVKTVEDHMVKALKHLRSTILQLILILVIFLLY